MNRSKYVEKVILAFSIFALSTGVSAKTYELECDTQVCSALTLAISFVNTHNSFFDFNDGDLFVVYDNYIAVDSVAYADVIDARVEVTVSKELDRLND